MRVHRITHVFISAFIISSLFFLSFSNISRAQMPGATKLQSVTESLLRPQKVALDIYENIYITEPGNNKVLIYNSIGEYITSLFGLDMPISIAVDSNGRIFIGNEGRGNVEVYGSNLEKLSELGGGNGEFIKPASIAIDSSTGNIYVVDMSADMVKIYNSNGTYAGSFGSTGSGDGQFSRPISIAIDEIAGEILVLDRQIITFGMFGDPIEGARVQIFGMDTSFKRSFGEYGFEEGQLNKPQGVSVDELGRIYVIDSYSQFIFVFESNGTYAGKISDVNNPVRAPMGITIGKSKRLFVTSLTRHKSDIYRISDGADEPYIEAAPRDNEFGVVSVGGSKVRTIEVFNLGGLDLLIGTNSITGPHAAEFSIQNDNCSGQTLTPSQKCTVDLVLSPGTTGAKDAILTITSDDPDDSSIDISLAGLGNIVPTSSIAPPASVVEGQEVIFDGSASYDGDGSIVEYEWDVDNDGTYEYSSTVSSTQNHTYGQDGMFTVKLRVTDNLGATHESTTPVSVSDTAPTADFVASQTTGTAPLPVTFINYSTGYDAPLSYEWDFDNNGTTDSYDVSPSYIYTSNNTYAATLKVTDADGSIDTFVQDIIVSSPQLTLTVDFTGAGSGAVSSSPAGIDCTADCSALFDQGNTVTLTAQADAGSVFTGWSGGGCSGTGQCIIALNSAITVTANFDVCGDPVRNYNTSVDYVSLQQAYTEASDGDIIYIKDVTMTEDLNANADKSITLIGGYNCSYSDNTGGTTILEGNMTLNNGTVVVEKINLIQ